MEIERKMERTVSTTPKWIFYMREYCKFPLTKLVWLFALLYLFSYCNRNHCISVIFRKLFFHAIKSEKRVSKIVVHEDAVAVSCLFNKIFQPSHNLLLDFARPLCSAWSAVMSGRLRHWGWERVGPGLAYLRIRETLVIPEGNVQIYIGGDVR